jgi:hypothetical protein
MPFCTADLNETSLAGALDHAPLIHGDGRINQIAPEHPPSRQGPILGRRRQPQSQTDRIVRGIADHGLIKIPNLY